MQVAETILISPWKGNILIKTNKCICLDETWSRLISLYMKLNGTTYFNFSSDFLCYNEWEI